MQGRFCGGQARNATDEERSLSNGEHICLYIHMLIFPFTLPPPLAVSLLVH